MDELLSEARFARYLNRYDGNRRLAMRLYTWNLAACAAQWLPINVLAIAVRNAIHNRLVERTGRGPSWSNTPIPLRWNERHAIDSAVSTLLRRGRAGRSAEQVGAATAFGLWVGRTGAGVPRDPLLCSATTLWRPRLQHAFPHRGDRR